MGTFTGSFSKDAATTETYTLSPPDAHPFLLAPDGSTVGSTRSCGGDTFIRATHLPFAGTYRVEIAPDTSGTGTGTVTYYSVTDPAPKLKLNKKPPVAVSLPTPGEIFLGTFAGHAGNEISASETSATCTSRGGHSRPDPTGGPPALPAGAHPSHPSAPSVAQVTAFAGNLHDYPQHSTAYPGWQVSYTSSVGVIRLPVGYNEAQPIDAGVYLLAHPDDAAG